MPSREDSKGKSSPDLAVQVWRMAEVHRKMPTIQMRLPRRAVTGVDCEKVEMM
jgi:hypothetical protein